MSRCTADLRPSVSTNKTYEQRATPTTGTVEPKPIDMALSWHERNHGAGHTYFRNAEPQQPILGDKKHIEQFTSNKIPTVVKIK